MPQKVLIVDDSLLIHNLLASTLISNGYEICGDAMNGKEAVEKYEELKPDIVFMDITMPIKDGLQASREIKEKDPNAKIIMLTAMGDQEVRGEADEIGISVFLKKPFNDYKIISALSQLVV